MNEEKIKSVTVTDLFGYDGNNFTVDFFSSKMITFLYGLNGVGKTTFFRLIYSALKTQLTILDSISFKSIKITFYNDESLIVEKTINKRFDDITISELQKDETGKYFFPIIYKWEPLDKKIVEGKWYFKKTISDMFSKMLNEDFDNNSKLHFFVDKKSKKQVLLSDFTKYVIKINKDEFINKIIDESLSSDLKFGGFYDIDILYANKDYNRFASSQRIKIIEDPYRPNFSSIFDNYNSLDIIPYSIEDFENLISSVRSKDEKTILLQLPDKTQDMKNFFRRLFTDTSQLFQARYYWPDMNFDENVERKISLFEELINHKPGLTDKDIFIDRITGDIKIKLFGQNDALLPIEKLSSGEKNWILLHFYLIFEVDDYGADMGMCLFIDEPEVSLHPELLINFADNCKKIFENSNPQIIISTHSPSITYYDSDAMTELRRI